MRLGNVHTSARERMEAHTEVQQCTSKQKTPNIFDTTTRNRKTSPIVPRVREIPKPRKTVLHDWGLKGRSASASKESALRQLRIAQQYDQWRWRRKKAPKEPSSRWFRHGRRGLRVDATHAPRSDEWDFVASAWRMYNYLQLCCVW